MNSNALKFGMTGLMSAALIVFLPGCSSDEGMNEYDITSWGSDVEMTPSTPTYATPTYATPTHAHGTSSEQIYRTSTGATVVETSQLTARVAAIDSATRTITLAMPDGRTRTVKAGPEVVNFNQIRVGDQVVANVTEQVAVYLAGQGQLPSTTQTTTVMLSPVGGKPGGVMAETTDVTAQVVSVDQHNRHVTLRFANGDTRTMKVGNQIDLTKISPGANVNIRVTEAVALDVRRAS